METLAEQNHEVLGKATKVHREKKAIAQKLEISKATDNLKTVLEELQKEEAFLARALNI